MSATLSSSLSATYASITDPTHQLSKLSLPFGMLLKLILNHFDTLIYCFKYVKPDIINVTSMRLMKLHASIPQPPLTAQSRLRRLLVYLRLNLVIQLPLLSAIHLLPLILAPSIYLTLIPHKTKAPLSLLPPTSNTLTSPLSANEFNRIH